MTDAFIVDAVRTPSGRARPTGLWADTHPSDLLATTLRGLVNRLHLDPGVIDDVIVGCVTQAGEQAMNIGRTAVLGAGFPVHVPATTIDRQCGSSQQAIQFAAQAVASGGQDVVIAAGVESMGRAPMWSNWLDRDPYGDSISRRYPAGLISQGPAAELVAAKYDLDREMLDAFSERSHRRAAHASATGGFDRELLQLDGRTVPDETIRATSLESLAALEPAFRDAALAARFPEIDWCVTAGNSSPLTDGAAAVLVVSETALDRYDLRPRARIHATTVVGDDPLLMLTGVIPATERVLLRAGLALDDIDAFEVNEAFACVPLAWEQHFGVDPARLNVKGGAIALGHPLGASGARLLTTLLGVLDDAEARYGLQTMCEAGGMANAMVVERLQSGRVPAPGRTW